MFSPHNYSQEEIKFFCHLRKNILINDVKIKPESFPKQADGKLQNNIWNLIPRNHFQSEIRSSKQSTHWNMISDRTNSLEALTTMATTPQTAFKTVAFENHRPQRIEGIMEKNKCAALQVINTTHIQLLE